jgi:hypothetical protein
MVCSFARVGAAVTMQGADLFQHRRQLWLRLHEKGASVMKFPVIPSWRAMSPLGPKQRELAMTRKSHYSAALAKANG